MIDGKLQIFFVFLRQLRLSHDHIRDCPHHVTSQISWFLHLAIHIILTYQIKETLNFFEESIELHPTGEYRITAYIQNIQIVLRLIIEDPPFSLMTKVRGPSSMITVLPVLIWENTKAASINMTLSFPLSRYCSSMENLILSPVFSFNSWSRPTSWKKLVQVQWSPISKEVSDFKFKANFYFLFSSFLIILKLMCVNKARGQKAFLKVTWKKKPHNLYLLGNGGSSMIQDYLNIFAPYRWSQLTIQAFSVKWNWKCSKVY